MTDTSDMAEAAEDADITEDCETCDVPGAIDIGEASDTTDASEMTTIFEGGLGAVREVAEQLDAAEVAYRMSVAGGSEPGS